MRFAPVDTGDFGAFFVYALLSSGFIECDGARCWRLICGLVGVTEEIKKPLRLQGLWVVRLGPHTAIPKGMYSHRPASGGNALQSCTLTVVQSLVVQATISQLLDRAPVASACIVHPHISVAWR